MRAACPRPVPPEKIVRRCASQTWHPHRNFWSACNLPVRSWPTTPPEHAHIACRSSIRRPHRQYHELSPWWRTSTYVLPSPQRLLRLRPSRSLKLLCFLLCGRDDVGFQATQQHRVIGVVKGRDNLWVLCQRIGKQSPFRLRPEQEWSNRDGEQAWNNGGQFLRNASRISEVGNYETGYSLPKGKVKLRP